jgi:3-methyl-2-oxobutanoate hydroxymethyltransferase
MVKNNMISEKITISTLAAMKKDGRKITMLTAYDFGMARLLNEAGIDAILVGDSVGMVKLGYESTLPVTLDDIIYHCKTVRRANTAALLIADMTFMSYEVNRTDAVQNAGRLVKSAGAEAVKLEGGREIVETVRAIIAAKIPVMGHLGLTPQSVHRLGGYKVQGRTTVEAQKMIDDAKALEAAGVFSLVLECVPAALAAEITALLSIPVIGIGAGSQCDGQVLVTDDLLGLYAAFTPKFVKQYANLRPVILEALRQYCADVKAGRFPSDEQSYT